MQRDERAPRARHGSRRVRRHAGAERRTSASGMRALLTAPPRRDRRAAACARASGSGSDHARSAAARASWRVSAGGGACARAGRARAGGRAGTGSGPRARARARARASRAAARAPAPGAAGRAAGPGPRRPARAPARPPQSRARAAARREAVARSRRRRRVQERALGLCNLLRGRARLDRPRARSAHSAPSSRISTRAGREGDSARRPAPARTRGSRHCRSNVATVVTTPPARELADARRKHLVRREPALHRGDGRRADRDRRVDDVAESRDARRRGRGDLHVRGARTRRAGERAEHGEELPGSRRPAPSARPAAAFGDVARPTRGRRDGSPRAPTSARSSRDPSPPCGSARASSQIALLVLRRGERASHARQPHRARLAVRDGDRRQQDARAHRGSCAPRSDPGR